MRQLLIRVPDDLHRRLTDTAAASGQSVNAIANRALSTAVSGAAPGTARTRLRLRAAALGALVDTPASALSSEERELAITSTHGLGPVLDRILDEERGPR